MEPNDKTSHNSNLPTLLTILGIFVAVLFGSFKLILSIQFSRAEIFKYDYEWILFALVFFTYFLCGYICLIIRAIYYETFFEESKDADLDKIALKKKESYIAVITGWPILAANSFISFLVVVFSFNYGRSIGTFVGIILGLIYAVSFYIIFLKPLMKNDAIMSDRLYNEFKTQLKSKKVYLKGILNIVLFIVYASFIMFLFSNVKITLDKEFYYDNEDVMVKIQPIGIIPPIINEVTYSNKNIVIYNGTNQPFGRSVRYLVLNSSVLLTQPYNSIIVVSFNTFPNSYLLLGKIEDVVTKNIPIYKSRQLQIEKNQQPKNSSKTLQKDDGSQQNTSISKLKEDLINDDTQLAFIGLVGSILAIFFSVILFIIGTYSKRYQRNVLDALKRDFKVKLCFLLFVFVLLLNISLFYYKIQNLFLNFGIMIFILVLLIYFWVHIIVLIDPLENIKALKLDNIEDIKILGSYLSQGIEEDKQDVIEEGIRRFLKIHERVKNEK